MIYPPDASPQTKPEAPPAKKGSHAPATRYKVMAAAPRRLPRAAPVSITAKVWPVIGTGVNPRGILICASRAVSRVNPTTRAISLMSRAFRASAGNMASTSALGWICGEERSVMSVLRRTVEDVALVGQTTI